METVKKQAFLFIIIALLAPQDIWAGKKDTTCEGAAAGATEVLDPRITSAQITEMVTTYFTTEKLLDAESRQIISKETKSFIEQAKKTLLETIRAGDQQFLENSGNPKFGTPGYTVLKEKILHFIKLFSGCLGYNKTKEYTAYNAYATGLRGALYELSAALQAVEHGDHILAFGANVDLIFNTENQAALVEKIKEKNFLRPNFPKKKPHCVLSQEFDLVTDHYVIECKCINDTINEYIQNFKREQFITNHAKDAFKIKIAVKGKQVPELKEHIIGKRIICYVKYTQGDTAYTEEQAKKELNFLKNGFTLWNGVLYCHTLPQDYFKQPQAAENLKAVIRAIGPNIVLHCIVNAGEQKELQAQLLSLGIEKKPASLQQTQMQELCAQIPQKTTESTRKRTRQEENPQTPPRRTETSLAESPGKRARLPLPRSPQSPTGKLFYHHTRLANKMSPEQSLPSMSAETQTLFVRSILFTKVDSNSPASPLSHAIQKLHLETEKKPLHAVCAAGPASGNPDEQADSRDHSFEDETATPLGPPPPIAKRCTTGARYADLATAPDDDQEKTKKLDKKEPSLRDLFIDCEQ